MENRNPLHNIHLPLSLRAHDGLAKLSNDFVHSLTSDEVSLVIQAFTVLDDLTNGHKAPKEFQVRAMLVVLSGRDLVVRAGTGSGKTLAMMLPHLLRPESKVLTCTPLKQLQASQVRTLL